MKQAVIDAHNLSKIYDEDSIPVVALDHAQLHLNRGEFTAIKGHLVRENNFIKYDRRIGPSQFRLC